jgi:transcriptional regulator with XRE-family HTH domain
MKLGYALREARLKRFPNNEKKQYEVASIVGVTATYLSQVELGRKEPSYELIKSLCDVYKIPPAVLLWMATESKDIDKKKRDAFELLRGPINSLINDLF